MTRTTVLVAAVGLAVGSGAIAFGARSHPDAVAGTIQATLADLPAPTYQVPGDFDDVQEALDASVSGDIVLLEPGVYLGPVTIPGGVTLASRHAYTGEPSDIISTIIDGGGADAAVSIAAGAQARATIVGITVQNAGDGIESYSPVNVFDCLIRDARDGIDFENGGGGLVRGCTFESNSDDGIDVDEAVDVLIEDNVIRDNGDDGIEVRLHPYRGPTLEVVIRNNHIQGNGEDGIQLIGYDVTTDRALRIEGNTFRDNAVVGIGMMDGAETVEDVRAASLTEPVSVIGNTFVNNGYGIAGGDNTLVVGNAFVGHGRVAVMGVDGDSVVSGNLFRANRTDAVGSNLGATSVTARGPTLAPVVWQGANVLHFIRSRSTAAIPVAALAP